MASRRSGRLRTVVRHDQSHCHRSRLVGGVHRYHLVVVGGGQACLRGSRRATVEPESPAGKDGRCDITGDTDIGEVTPFDYGTREFTATTVTEVCAVAIERDQLLAWMTECPEITHQIMRLLARRADVMTKCLVDFVFADPPYRVARRLLLLGRRFGRREGDVVWVTHDLTLEEISLFAGVAPETVDATLCDFRDRGWIRFEDSCLEIVDGQGLAALPARQ
jgi:CRP/FNR family transcriptional regulator, cyclic AMP receptor protein